MHPPQREPHHGSRLVAACQHAKRTRGYDKTQKHIAPQPQSQGQKLKTQKDIFHGKSPAYSQAKRIHWNARQIANQDSQMTKEIWTTVENYICGELVPSDPALEAALSSAEAAGMPTINVSPNFGKVLHILARTVSARNILEVGTLAGYSTIWLARALQPGGRLITLEFDPKHAEIARANLGRAGLSDIVEVRLGKALETLPKLAAEKRGPFDLIFIDADKASNADYFQWALKLARIGSLIIVDNVVRDGQVADAKSTDPNILGVRRLNDLLSKETRATSSAIQTVGSKGYDGFSLSIVVAT
jgi:predicted O-methyltransferase YrrM